MRLVHDSMHSEAAATLRERIFAGHLAPGSLLDEAAVCALQTLHECLQGYALARRVTAYCAGNVAIHGAIVLLANHRWLAHPSDAPARSLARTGRAAK